jgi:hypothetical protein
MTRRARWLAAAAAVAALAGHLAYWYAPRERPASPDRATSAWLRAPGWEVAAWIPYPHQNLALIEDRVGDLRAWLELVAGAPARGGHALPSFGAFVVPPARSLAFAEDGAGRVRAELAAYPSVAWLARAAGWLARNPWLAGGSVRWGERGRGTVRWSGSRWIFAGATAGDGTPLDPEALAGGTGEEQEALALVRTGKALGPLPAALYRIQRDAASGRLEVLAGAPAPTPAAVARLFAATATGPAGWLAETGPGEDLAAIALWDADSDVPGLAAMATFARGPGRGFRLPTEGLARLVGRRLAETESHGLRIRALEAATAERAVAFAPALAAALEPGSGAPTVLAAARPAALAKRARTAADALEEIPVVGAAEAQPLRRLEELLAPLAECAGATLEVAAGGASVRLVPCT